MIIQLFEELINNPINTLIYIGIFSFILLITITFHEFSHSFIANKLGDRTSKNLGRLTLNPTKHLDPMGTIMLFFVGFGWGKPVPVNPTNLNNPRSDMIKVAAAGPISNFILSFLGVLILTAIHELGMLQKNYQTFFSYFIIINTYLGLFNLIPIYPLDGGQIFGNIISKYNRNIFIKLNEYGPKILLGVILLSFITQGRISILGWIIETPATLIVDGFHIIAKNILFFL